MNAAFTDDTCAMEQSLVCIILARNYQDFNFSTDICTPQREMFLDERLLIFYQEFQLLFIWLYKDEVVL